MSSRKRKSIISSDSETPVKKKAVTNEKKSIREKSSVNKVGSEESAGLSYQSNSKAQATTKQKNPPSATVLEVPRFPIVHSPALDSSTREKTQNNGSVSAALTNGSKIIRQSNASNSIGFQNHENDLSHLIGKSDSQALMVALILLALFLCSNVVVGGLLLHARLTLKMSLLQQEQNYAISTQRMRQNEMQEKDFEIATLRSQLERMETQNKALETEFSEILEEIAQTQM